jgi:hypothetical protein
MSPWDSDMFMIAKTCRRRGDGGFTRKPNWCSASRWRAGGSTNVYRKMLDGRYLASA